MKSPMFAKPPQLASKSVVESKPKTKENVGAYSVDSMQIAHLSAILQMKTQQVQQLEAEIRNLIKIQSDQANKLISTFNETLELQKQLNISRKAESQAKAIQGDDTYSASISRLMTATGERIDESEDCAFLRCFIYNDEALMDKLIKKMQSIQDTHQRGTAAQSLFHQIQKFLELYHSFEVLCNEYTKPSFIPTLEDRMRSLIDCKKVFVYVRVPTADVFVSPTAGVVVPVGKGLISNVLSTMEKTVIKDPTKDQNYFPTYDDFAVGLASSVLIQPITNSKKEVQWIIEIVDRIDSQGNVIQPKPEDYLIIDYISTCIQRIYQGESAVDELTQKILIDTTKALLSERQVMPLLESVQLTISRIIGCEALQIFFVDENNNSLFQLREAAHDARSDDINIGSFTRAKTNIDNAGIAGVAYKTKSIINISIAKEHNGFNMMIDGEYPNGSLLALPIMNSSGNVQLIAVARQKRSGMMFTKTDEIMLEALSRVYSGALSNAQSHETNIQNIQKARTNHKYYTALLAVAQELSAELDTNLLIRKVMTKAQSFIGADRCSLFMVDSVRGGLWSIVAHGENSKIFVPLGEGIAGTVAKTGEIINIPDAYNDPRFNSAVDKKTGYITKSILCVPIRGNDGEIMGCTQMINKLNGSEFSKTDVELMSAFNVFCGIALSNAQLYESATRSKKKMSAILDIVLSMSSTSTLNQLVTNLSAKAKDLVESKHVFIFAIDKERHMCHPIAVKGAKSFSTRNDVVGYVATSGAEVNENDPNNDQRFDNTFLSFLGIIPKSILAIPIMDSLNQVIGVIEAVDKIGSPKFTQDDQLLFRNFSAFAGIAMQRCMIKSPEDFWKPEVEFITTLSPSEQKGTAIPQRLRIIDPLLSKITSIEFDAIAFPKNEQFRIVSWFFYDLGLMEKFNISFGTLLRFIAAVSDQYHHVPFHDFNHAVDVVQMIYMIIKVGRLYSNFTKLELLAILVAGICHDIGHHGKSSHLQQKMSVPFSILFKDQPIMETFHCSTAIHTIGKPGCNILASMDPNQIHEFWVLFIDAILATEESQAKKIVRDVEEAIGNDSVMSLENSQQKAKLLRIILKAGDFCDTTKPFDISTTWSTVLAEDFLQSEESEKIETQGVKLSAGKPSVMQSSIKSSKAINQVMEAAKAKIEALKDYAHPIFQILSRAVPLVSFIETAFTNNIKQWDELIKVV